MNEIRVKDSEMSMRWNNEDIAMYLLSNHCGKTRITLFNNIVNSSFLQRPESREFVSSKFNVIVKMIYLFYIHYQIQRVTQ